MPTAREDSAAPNFKVGGLPSSFRLNSKSEITKARTPTTHTGRIYINNFLCNIPSGCRQQWPHNYYFSLLSVNRYGFMETTGQLFINSK